MNNKTEFEKLFQPIIINQMTLANRMVLPAMGNNYGSGEGFVTGRQIDYYTERANGGAGLLITEMVSIDSPVGQRGAQQLRIDDDKYIPSFRKLTEQIHQAGSKMAMQLCHAGLLAASDKFPLQTVAPSPIEYFGQKVTKELSAGEIEDIINHFVQGAKRAKAANFDGVEVHAAHSYLLAHFLSPYFNRRRDDFGGSVENRARILLEIIGRIKLAVGTDYPVWCRMNGMEFGLEGGLTIDESKQIARMTEKAGCDAIHVSAGGYGSYYGYNRAHMGQPWGNMAELAAEIKKAISIPVIAVGRISLQLGEQLLQDGKADLIAIGRGNIADPHLLKKASEGRFDEIRPCLSCNVCVDDLTMLDVSLHCSVNACVGQERASKITKAAKIKNVLIAGGGPAGMEAAITAKLRGHNVIIYEQQPQLGGKLILAASPPQKDEIGPFKDYLVSQVKKSGIQVEFGKKVTLSVIKKLQPDVLVLAAGSLPLFPKILGIDTPNVILAEEVLSGWETGQKVIVIGGGLVGCETAEFLAQQNKSVIIVEMLAEIATGVGHSFKAGLLTRLSASGVTMITGMQCKKITANYAVVASKTGEEKTINADTIVLAVGAKPNGELAKTAAVVVHEIHVVGDCLEPRRIINAIGEGHRAGMMI